MLSLANGGQVAEEVASVEGLPGARETHENEGLVAASCHHVPIGLLASCKDVWRHVLSSTASEHVYHLQKEGEEKKKFVDFHINCD